MKTFEVVLLGRSRLVRVNYDHFKARPTDYAMCPTSIRALFIGAEHSNQAKGIASYRKRNDERILSITAV